MLRKLRINVEGRVYDVTVEDITDTGENLYPSPAVNAAALAPSAPAPASPPPAAAPAAKPSLGDASPNDKLSPLGGVVQTIDVAVGQQVAEGDKLCVIEAMKMKTTITAHKAGTIANIAIEVDQAVDAGQILMTIE